MTVRPAIQAGQASITPEGLEESLPILLWSRAKSSAEHNSPVNHPLAVQIIARIDCDFSDLYKRSSFRNDIFNLSEVADLAYLIYKFLRWCQCLRQLFKFPTHLRTGVERKKMSEEMLAELRRIGEQLESLKTLKELEMKEAISTAVTNLASTSARKRMWTLCDGAIGTSEIAKKTQVNVRSVQYFLQEGTKAGLIGINRKGRPFRKFDWVPSEWAVGSTEENVKQAGEVADAEQ